MKFVDKTNVFDPIFHFSYIKTVLDKWHKINKIDNW